ncbi:VQ-like protein [Artemisia annua]|uniref:VQ-like protein n=1 Tax=Artemisia annua TaxID=35608 RepID=A0A2U1KJB8_ARTAN|nr:VQ-like protein [Artemisia annua]
MATTSTSTSITATTQLQRLYGPKPTPLMINKNSSKISKNQSHKPVSRGGDYKSPVIVYLKSPEVVHVLPHEFMTTVQRLTGKTSASSSHQDL